MVGEPNLAIDGQRMEIADPDLGPGRRERGHPERRNGQGRGRCCKESAPIHEQSLLARHDYRLAGSETLNRLAREDRRGHGLERVRAMVVKLSDQMTAPLRQRSQMFRGKVAACEIPDGVPPCRAGSTNSNNGNPNANKKRP